MKKILFLLLLVPVITKAQIFYPFGKTIDSTTFTFSDADSLDHLLACHYDTSGIGFPASIVSTRIDTSSAHLWRIGNTLKPVFSNDTLAVRGIMTDTLNPYPKNANDFFVLKVGFQVPNMIVDIWHKYQMDSLHAGGIVEYSLDNGSSWLNIANCTFINTENCYTTADTVFSGDPAFTGKSNGEQLSRIQFMNCEIIGLKQTATTCMPLFFTSDSIYVRFRFVSDSTTDSLSGWLIDSIKIEDPGCIFIPGQVAAISNHNTINVSPNPAYSILTIVSQNNISQITITNLLGQTMFTNSCNAQKAEVNVADFPPGIYLIKINGSEVQKFIKE